MSTLVTSQKGLYRSQTVLKKGDSFFFESLAALSLTGTRLAQLETIVRTLFDRIDSHSCLSAIRDESVSPVVQRTPSESSISSSSTRGAPIFLIQSTAKDVGIQQDQQIYDGVEGSDKDDDLISSGVITLQDASQLLSIFRLHYGHWVKFDDSMTGEQLMAYVRGSPLLFCSLCLVAARHLSHQSVNDLALVLFRKSKTLLQEALLIIPQPIEFFQAAITLSLWSTTIGQIPLSIDSWLLTSYALQQGLTTSISSGIKRNTSSRSPESSQQLRACCIWNHLTLAHLQYCVGTGRRPLLNEAQINRCADVLDFEVSQFEVRMVAELKLYWIIFTRCCASTIDLPAIKTALHAWKSEWSFLFKQPRAQFLAMGHHFAVLLALCRSLHLRGAKISRSKLNEMMHRAQEVINLAINNTDERTPHLTDHIYHIVTFSAITLCHLIGTYSHILGENTVAPLNDLILNLIGWLRSIGQACHVGRLLAKIVSGKHTKSSSPISARVIAGTTSADVSAAVTGDQGQASHEVRYDNGVGPGSATGDFVWATFFDFNADTMMWPQHDDMSGEHRTPSWTDSWAASWQEGMS